MVQISWMDGVVSWRFERRLVRFWGVVGLVVRRWRVGRSGSAGSTDCVGAAFSALGGVISRSIALVAWLWRKIMLPRMPA